jgi:LCP family protein required for cell wall assembly
LVSWYLDRDEVSTPRVSEMAATGRQQVPKPTPPSHNREWRGQRGWRRWLPWVGAVAGSLVAIASAVIVLVPALINKVANDNLHQESLLAPAQVGKDFSGAINVLLIGHDERTNELGGFGADSVIILHVNAAHTQVFMVSVPRDSMVAIPAFPASKFPGTSRAKLTDAFAAGNQTFNAKGQPVSDDSPAGRARGVQALTQVLSNITPGGLTFNAVAIVSFSGFQKLVEAIGGIKSMCVDERTLSEHYDNKGNYVSETYGNPKIAKTYPVGCYPMLPWEAMDFVRQRHYLANGDGDYGRQRHQQQFLMTVFKQLANADTLSSPTKLTGIMHAAGDLFTVDLGGHSPADWVYTLRRISSNNITMIKTNAGQYSPVVIDGVAYEQIVPDTTKLLAALTTDTVEEFLATHPTWGTAAPAATTTTTAPPTANPTR